jgi:hypothetical protein
MSLPYRQQRRLSHIGRALRGSDPQLAAMLLIFARLTEGERMPAREQLGLRRRGMWPLLMRLLSLVSRLAVRGAGATSAGLRQVAAGGRRVTRGLRAWICRRPAAPAAGHGVPPARRDRPRSSPDK